MLLSDRPSLLSYIDPIQILHSYKNVHTDEETFDLSLWYVFHINRVFQQFIKLCFVAFAFEGQFISFFLIIFRLWIISGLSSRQLFFIEWSNTIFTAEISNNTYSWHNMFYFLHDKNFLRPIWSVALCKNIFIFWYPHRLTKFEFRIFVIMLNTIVNISTQLNIRFYFYCSMICIVVFVN